MAKTPAPNDDAPSNNASSNNAASNDAASHNAAPTSATPSNSTPTRNVAASRVAHTPTQPTVAPTEQLPMDTPPVSASAAASGGATGLAGSTNAATDGDSRPPSVFRRHPLATGVAAGVIAVVLVSGLTAWGVGSAVTASLTSSNSSAMAMPTSTATPAPAAGRGAGGAAAGNRLAFRATIQSMSGDSWTILTRKGQTVTVSVTSATQFGTKKSAETSGSFAVGDSVIIVATKGTDGTPTATRVVTSPVAGAAPTPTATPNA